MTKACDQMHGHVTQNMENGEIDRLVDRQDSEECVSSDNGCFDLLPVRCKVLCCFFTDI